MDCHTLFHVFQVCLSLQIAYGLDKVRLLNPPEEAVSGHHLKVLYSCDTPATVQLDCIVYFETGTTSTLLIRHWSCDPGNPRVRTLILSLPDWLVYQADDIIPHTQWVFSSLLRVTLGDSEERSIRDQDVVNMQLVPFLSRPFKQHQLCPNWSTQMLRLTQMTSRTRCPLEKETVYLLSSMYGSTGEKFGVTKTLQPFNSEVVEHWRLKAVSYPWCVFSVWIFVTRHCQHSLCGILHHIDSHDDYATPLIFLTNAGQLHIQMNGESGVSSAFLSPFRVPLSQWCNLNMVLRGRMVSASLVCMDKEERVFNSAEHTFSHTVEFDDTDGYFVIGGGKYVNGLEGYFGPLVYYRNRIPPHHMSEVVVPELIKSINLTGWLQTCQDFHLELNVKIGAYSRIAGQKAESDSCVDAYYNWIKKYSLHLKSQCEPWETSIPQRRQAVKLAKVLVFKYGGRKVDLKSVGSALYSLSLHKMNKAGHTGIVGRIMPLLLQAGCLGHTHALHLSSVLYSSGLGVRQQPNKAWLLALLAAQKDSRLALLRLGHMHHQGDHGIPLDPDLAYGYYVNIAKQTSLDRHNPTPQQKFVESVYLNDDETLKLQTNEDHHIFQWLKIQARNGAADAEQAIGRMLFWGQQGVSPNIEKAIRHYERGAVRLEDPVSMYDYAIVLLTGRGVKKDIPRAVTFLRKAAEQGFAPAINALGWYYEQFEKDYEQAVQLWEQADLHGSPDAAMNLGVMYSQGLYPGKAADQFMAYTYYLKSAQRGHISGAIALADMWTTGIPGHVNRRPSDAVLWTKWAAEHNGYLGNVLRKGLDSYFQSNMLMSLVYYIMAADSGFAVAQFNVAYLCEQNIGGFLDPDFAAKCMMRYYNLTTQSQSPDTYALIRMGDLLYEEHDGSQKDVFSAAQMYKQAALRNEPQGWYNLGLLAQGGYRLPLSVLLELGIPELYLSDKTVLLTTLYTKCRDSERTDSYLPCTLALYNVYLQTFKQDYIGTIKVSRAVAIAVAAPPVLCIILGILRGWGLSLH